MIFDWPGRLFPTLDNQLGASQKSRRATGAKAHSCSPPQVAVKTGFLRHRDQTTVPHSSRKPHILKICAVIPTARRSSRVLITRERRRTQITCLTPET